MIFNLNIKIKENENSFSIGLLHCIFIIIHPFEDRNGRMGRALASIILEKASFLPSTIPPELKEEYHSAQFKYDRSYFKTARICT